MLLMNDIKEKKHKAFDHWKGIALLMIVYDAIAVSVSYVIALWLRFDGRYSLIPTNYYHSWLKFCPIYIIFSIILFHFMKLYRSMWRFASFSELIRTFIASSIASVFHAVAITLIFERMPVSYYVMGAIFQFFAVLSIRFVYRLVLLLSSDKHSGKRTNNVMIIGAGSAGQMILRDINRASGLDDKVVAHAIGDGGDGARVVAAPHQAVYADPVGSLTNAAHGRRVGVELAVIEPGDAA